VRPDAIDKGETFSFVAETGRHFSRSSSSKWRTYPAVEFLGDKRQRDTWWSAVAMCSVTKKQRWKGATTVGPAGAGLSRNCSSADGRELVPRLRLEITAVVRLMQLTFRFAVDAVDRAPALLGQPLEKRVGSSLDGIYPVC
jgi:hypothetical protein